MDEITDGRTDGSVDSSAKIGKKAKEGILWTTFFGGISFVLRFGTTIILARLLFPKDFGLMGMAALVMTFARQLTSFGFSMVLIQRKELTREHVDTVFLFGMFLMALTTLTVLIGAPYLAAFFKNDALTLILRVVSFQFLLQGVGSVCRATLTREMRFKDLGMARTFGSVTNLVSPVIFALLGLGVWSLVWGHILGGVVNVVALLYYSKWYPTFRFRFWALKDVFSFGMWIYINRYMLFFMNKADQIVIGRVFGDTMLGFYERAYNMMSLPRKRIARTINNVLFSAYSRIQDDDERTVRALKRVITTVSFVVYGGLPWLFFAAPSLITTLYGPRWVSTIEPLQIMCIAGLFNTVTMVFYPVINAKALVAHRARRQFVFMFIFGAMLWVGVDWGMNGVAWAVAASSVVLLLLLLQLITKHLPFSVADFVAAQRSPAIYAAVQIAAVVLFQLAVADVISSDSPWMLLAVTVLAATAYLGSHLVFRFPDVQEILEDIFKEVRKFLKKFYKRRNARRNRKVHAPSDQDRAGNES